MNETSNIHAIRRSVLSITINMKGLPSVLYKLFRVFGLLNGNYFSIIFPNDVTIVEERADARASCIWFWI